MAPELSQTKPASESDVIRSPASASSSSVEKCEAFSRGGSRQAETERQPAAGTGQQWLALAGSGPNETSSEADEEKNEAKDEDDAKDKNYAKDESERKYGSGE